MSKKNRRDTLTKGGREQIKHVIDKLVAMNNRRPKTGVASLLRKIWSSFLPPSMSDSSFAARPTDIPATGPKFSNNDTPKN